MPALAMETDGSGSVHTRGADGSDSNERAFKDACAELIARLGGRHSPFDRYRVESRIGEGASGLILKARDEDLRRDLAMKVLRGPGEGLAERERTPLRSRQLARFLEEAQITGQLDHPGIVPVHELGLDPSGRLYFTMKLVRGRTLRDVLELVWKGEEGWSTTRVVGVLLKVCEALSYAHERRVIHRDLKPGNIMVGRFGEVFVMDWGLARLLDQEDHKDIRVRGDGGPASTVLESDRRAARPDDADSPLVTMEGDIVGTPAYMSPEQALGRMDEVQEQTDVYAVGAILYHVLTRSVPYVNPDARPRARVDNFTIWRWVQKGPPTPVHEVAPDAPEELVAICEKAMERDRSRRYPSAASLADDLRAYLENRVVRAHRTGPLVELRKWTQRNRVAALAVVAVTVTLFAAIGVVAWKERQRANEIQRGLDEQAVADLIRRASSLWPVHPDRIDDLRDWLEEARALERRSAAHEQPLQALVARAAAAGSGREVKIVDPSDVDPAIGDLTSRAQAFSEHLEGQRAKLGDSAEQDAMFRALESVLRPEIAYFRARASELIARAKTSSWAFDERDEQRTYDRLVHFGGELRELRTKTIPSVEARLAAASSLRRRSIDDHADEWDEAVASIADATKCPRYDGLRIERQLGLVPLGRDESSGLWEFWHVLSGDRPARNDAGAWEIGPKTGLVFVLIPGGRTCVGAQRADAAADRFDPAASLTEKPQWIELAPYLLSKYEMTQGQWFRATGDVPSHYWSAMSVAGERRITRANPVENVSWDVGQEVLAQWGLTFPTEAQWEHAARGGTSARYGASEEFGSIARACNWADAKYDILSQRTPDPATANDGFGVHAVVGSFPPNGFGLHETLGNVAEWCLDWYADSCDKAVVRPIDGERRPPFSRTKVYRGGCFKYAAPELRVSRRLHAEPYEREETLGVRPARALDASK